MTLDTFPSARPLLILAARAVVSGFLTVPAFRGERWGVKHA
jgi:hypothetical protein